MKIEVPLLWPQIRFWCALQNPAVRRVGYGGSRGGGKSDISRRALIWRRIQHPGSNGILFRRTIKAVMDNHCEPIKLMLKQMGIPFAYNGARRIFHLLSPYSGEIHLGFAEKLDHAELYQGIPYLDMAFDEATQFEERLFQQITASNRCELPGAQVKIWVTCNPGGRGHGWVRRSFVEPQFRAPDTVFIPSRLRDNVILNARDPGYADRLTRELPEWKRRQWLDGDWSAMEDAYFAVPADAVKEIDLREKYWARWAAGVDYGYSPSAYAVVWIAYWKEQDGARRAHIALELKRLRMEMDEQAAASLEMEATLPIQSKIARYADPSTGRRLEGESDDVGRTVASIWARHGFATTPARRTSRVAGWRVMQMLLNHGALTIDPGCRALLEELREAVYKSEESRPGADIDPGCQDHLLDAARYALMSIYPLEAAGKPADSYSPLSVDYAAYLDARERSQRSRGH